jgi:hypothetical protein
MEILQEDLGNKGRFYIGEKTNKMAEMTYSKAGDKMIIIDHTEVSEELRGTGTGKKLVLKAVEMAREKHIKILPLCPFAKSVFDKDDSLSDVLS